MNSQGDCKLFQVRVPGKFVLAGEHTVLKGGMAIAFPHPEYGLKLGFLPDESAAELKIEPASAESVIQDLLQAAEDQFTESGWVRPLGVLKIESSIPMGAGLGSSGALCAAMSLWISGPMGFSDSPDRVFEFARELENRFHGRSSGMDVAVSLVGKPVAYSMERGVDPIRLKTMPEFRFFDTGLRASTRDCIERVEEFRQMHPIRGQAMDDQMRRSARQVLQALETWDQDFQGGRESLGQALNLAQGCFEAWGLVPAEAQLAIQEAKNQGARGAKLTGAGSGGFVVAVF